MVRNNRVIQKPSAKYVASSRSRKHKYTKKTRNKKKQVKIGMLLEFKIPLCNPMIEI